MLGSNQKAKIDFLWSEGAMRLGLPSGYASMMLPTGELWLFAANAH